MMAECVERSSMSCGEMERMKISAHKPLIMALLMGTCSEQKGDPFRLSIYSLFLVPVLILFQIKVLCF